MSDELFPVLRGVVLNNGHIDPVTGPRCMVKMSEGPHRGKYVIAHTDSLLAGGIEVHVQEKGKRKAWPCGHTPDPNGPPPLERWHPEELGWQRIGPRAWERPDGTRHEFPVGWREEVLIRPPLRKGGVL